MDEQYYFSPSRNGFFFLSLKSDYEQSEHGWPTDAVEITERWYQYLIDKSSGKIIVPNEYGQPVLSDPLPLSQEELIVRAETQKSALMAAASNILAPLQDAVDLGKATDAEKALFTAWREYRVSLMRIDTDSATDIVWPEQPDDVA